MAKSPKQRGGRIPFAAGSPRFAAPGKTASASDLIPRAQPAIDLESFLAKANSTGVRWSSAGPAASPEVSSARARKAERCASAGARLVSEGRPAEAIPMTSASL
jgi:hypothetical protein